MMRQNMVRATIYGLTFGIGTALVIGLPTDVIANPWFTRMIPTRTQDYIFLSITSILAAILGATFAFPASCTLQEGKLAGGGMLSFLTVGCPICNKIILLLLGTGGALRYFEPIQPLIGVVSIALLGVAIWIRLRALGVIDPLALRSAGAQSNGRKW